MRYKTAEHQLLPTQISDQTHADAPYEILPGDDGRSLLAHGSAELLITALYQIAIESALSEQFARIASMRLAVENARRIAEQLRFEFNLARQRQTTNGLLELISGYRTMTETPQPSDSIQSEVEARNGHWPLPDFA
jgi:F0F1-type ATP synthase gamma subunit